MVRRLEHWPGADRMKGVQPEDNKASGGPDSSLPVPMRSSSKKERKKKKNQKWALDHGVSGRMRLEVRTNPFHKEGQAVEPARPSGCCTISIPGGF